MSNALWLDNMADARRILDEAKALWIKTSADVLGVGMKGDT